MSRYQILKAAAKACHYLQCPLREMRGETLKYIFNECEYGGAVVWWGLWSEKELNHVI